MNLIEAQQVAGQFGLQGQCSIVKDSAKIETNSGTKCIKRLNYNMERLMYIYEVKEYLVKNGFPFVDRFLLSPKENPYAEYNNGLYSLTNCIEGKECNFDNIIDIKIAVESLARLHYSALGFSPSEGVKPRSEIGKLPGTLKKRSEEMLKLKKIAQKGKTRFDYLFMENVDFFIGKSLSSLKSISCSTYLCLVEKADKNREICHRDYSYHNLIFNKEGNLCVINFDYCCFEIRVCDIVSFLRKIMCECKWSVELALNVINWYDAINKLDQNEIKVIFALLEFPQKFWRIANRHYNSRRTRPETGFYNKLSDVIAEKECYVDFLNKFREYIM